MQEKLEKELISVWRQALVEDRNAVELKDQRFPVKQTSRHRLRQVDFTAEGQQLRGLEQNPETGSRWAQLAREGKKVMQVLSGGRYVAVVVEGKVIPYGERRGTGTA
jgi:hypothetical protein